MNWYRPVLFVSLLRVTGHVAAQHGSLTPTFLQELQKCEKLSSSERVIRNTLQSTDISTLAINAENQIQKDFYFSHEVPSKGITDQKSSGRCWLFSGLNVLRSQATREHQLSSLTFSQVYLFFYDQLEKSNLFLQAVIDTRHEPMTNQTVDWLFRNPLSDGGTFCGVADLVMKYGLVPSGVMPEPYAANNTSRFTSLLKRKLREDALLLRQAKGKNTEEMKENMLKEIYHMLVLGFGQPPTSFTWAPKASDGKSLSKPKIYTPVEFYHMLFGSTDLTTDYIMLMNDPTRPYWETYEIAYDRHTYDGHNWCYLNVPMEEIKNVAIASIKDSTMMYMSCDVSKELDRARGLLDLHNYDYESVLGVKFNMNKHQRILSFDSGSTHAMALMAVDLDKDEKPTKWMVENSWGADNGYHGHLVMTDQWLDEYLFRLVISKRYANEKMLRAAAQRPHILPCWDPMFQDED